MQHFIGVKEIKAKEMSRLDYNNYRGWELPEDENGSDLGYLVEYLDGGQSNHPDHENYISWSPKDVFNRAYRSVEGMTFGQAIEAMKKGNNVQRQGWNGKKMFIFIERIATEEDGLKRDSFISMFTAQKTIQPGWLASQADMLSEDWQIVE